MVQFDADGSHLLLVRPRFGYLVWTAVPWGGDFISVILFGPNNVGVTAHLNTSNTLNLKNVYNFLNFMDFLRASLCILNPPNCPSPGQQLVLTPVYDLYFCIFIVTANECTNVMLGKDTLRLLFMLSFIAWPDILQCSLLEDVFIGYHHDNKRTEQWSFFRQWDDSEEKARKLVLTWANHFLFSHSCCEVQCLYSDHRRSKMLTRGQMLWGNQSQKSLGKTYFNLISFLPQRDVVTMFSVSRWPRLSIYEPPRRSQSSNHWTVWNTRCAHNCFSFSKIQTTELEYLCLPRDPLDAFPTLMHLSGE